ncbi:hypothetical protein [Streptomyces atratus]
MAARLGTVTWSALSVNSPAGAGLPEEEAEAESVSVIGSSVQLV